jgi:mannitol-1-/sugar-/sorbitol-6-phosphatase
MTRIECLGVLFDLDGVLIDSNPAVDRVWRRWAIEHGLDPNELIRAAHGRPSMMTIREYISAEFAEAENNEVERREIADIEGIVPLPGVMGLLRTIPPERWAIVTSGTYPLANARIKAAGLPTPKNLVTSSDIINGKPDPEPYLRGAAKLGLAPKDCVVLEDAGAGIRAGQAAGARVIGVRSPTASDAELMAAGAEWLVNNCADVAAQRDSKNDALVLLIESLVVPLVERLAGTE